MKGNFDTKAASSIVLWLDNKICKDGEGYVQKDVIFYKQPDAARAPLIAYASPYKQWVYDSCVAPIISGVYTQSGAIDRSNGIFFDFNNGRVLSSGDLGARLTGTILKKEYNVYFTTDDQANLFIERNYQENKNISYQSTGIEPYVFSAPCVFVTPSFGNNDPWALGGIDKSNRTYRIYVVSHNNHNQEALNGLILDSAHKMLPLIDDVDSPFNFYGDLKSGYYNYCDLRSKYNCASGLYINNVYSYKVDSRANKSNTLLLSFFELQTEIIRVNGNST